MMNPATPRAPQSGSAATYILIGVAILLLGLLLIGGCVALLGCVWLRSAAPSVSPAAVTALPPGSLAPSPTTGSGDPAEARVIWPEATEADD